MFSVKGIHPDEYFFKNADITMHASITGLNQAMCNLAGKMQFFYQKPCQEKYAIILLNSYDKKSLKLLIQHHHLSIYLLRIKEYQDLVRK